MFINRHCLGNSAMTKIKLPIANGEMVRNDFPSKVICKKEQLKSVHV